MRLNKNSQDPFHSNPAHPKMYLHVFAGAMNCIHQVSEDDVRAGKICWSSSRMDLLCLPEFADIALEIMAQQNLEHPNTPTQAKELFLVLVNLLQNLIKRIQCGFTELLTSLMLFIKLQS